MRRRRTQNLPRGRLRPIRRLPPPTRARRRPRRPAFDPTTLPSLDSIDATTDIRAFLARGVPAALGREALRRAWLADPAVRDFVGPAENAWDFTAPGGVPGFGPLAPAAPGLPGDL